MSVLILMTRLSDYMLNCIEAFKRDCPADIHVVHRRADTKQAPYHFENRGLGLVFHERESFSDAELTDFVNVLQPKLILCFGWSDKSYLNAVKRKPVCSVSIMTMDNQWTGSPKQLLGCVWSRLTLRQRFDFVWVPGARQYKFARRLGFSSESIFSGLYVANARNFNAAWDETRGAPIRRFIFVGRLVPSKGVLVLWEAFLEFQESSGSEWHLLCIGTGPLETFKPNHPQIRCTGFVQPADLPQLVQGGGVFVLPSIEEPWGLVVQEFALAGFPLILSDQVGASDQFLTEANGLQVRSGKIGDLVGAFRTFHEKSDGELGEMANASRILGESLSVDDWVLRMKTWLQLANDRLDGVQR